MEHRKNYLFQESYTEVTSISSYIDNTISLIDTCFQELNDITIENLPVEVLTKDNFISKLISDTISINFNDIKLFKEIISNYKDNSVTSQQSSINISITEHN